MDSTSVEKPVDLQGLSLALARTAQTYDAKINEVYINCQPDWEADDPEATPNKYIYNKPAIVAGEGKNSVMIGQIEQSTGAAVYTIYITGDAGATTYSFTSNDTFPSSLVSKRCLVYRPTATVNKYQYIDAIDLTNNTITFSKTLSKTAISQEEVVLYYAYKMAVGDFTSAEGYGTTASGTLSHAEGSYTKALGSASHSEGLNSVAYGMTSHSEGSGSIARGLCGHAEGIATIVNGSYSHAEGSTTIVNGDWSHAEGSDTIASSNYQHVQGKYNIEDISNTYAHIVGNGTSTSARSNAHTLDWSGNGWYAGKVSAGTESSPANPTAANDLTTKAYVDAAVAGTTVNLPSYLINPSEYVSLTGETAISDMFSCYIVFRNDLTNDTVTPFFCTNIQNNTSSREFVSSEGLMIRYQPNVGWRYDDGDSDVAIDFSDTAITYEGYKLAVTSDLSGLADTNISEPPTEGQILTYDATTSKWVNTSAPSYSLSMTNNVITLTGSGGSTSSITLPIYNGSVSNGGGS